MENIERSWPIVRPRDGSSKYPKSKIEQLPYDIHISIFNALQVEDTVSLAITCWVMWDAIKNILPAAMEAIVFPLAAQHRIICVEDYVLKDDYPPGMLTEEELAEASKAGGLYLWTRGFEYWNKDNGILPPAAMVPWSPDRCIFQEIVKKQLPQVRVIRNLSKKEYIRESGITVGADREEMGITQAILSRICCSHDPSMAYQEDIHCGTWAGDRIDIMCENRHNAILMAESKDPSKAPWKDVTEACVQMLLDIRSAQI
ncbi:hypothetical protein BU17DRAFT_96458 [Hysterangium stoloniferum]|nr:hypothetical protein BU17DRAFT_104282 [Hysterangium stoloniferum]KAF8498320.1 hypothetical protein BU17DRAFT_103104 [Hysterangium stoloniferum]KAF8505043.1 hypothetical protein BU17DRAFT_101276 [Hysterangium stoloniferum]KAF8512209.1 hypothetical protein BU17DRAFT_96458 [Hysterangium stoloniferum]